MNSSLSFLAGILSTVLLVPSAARFLEGQNNQAALAKQSSIVFSGTVSQLGAVSFVGVPQSPQTIVVRVDSVLKKPPAVSLKKGDIVTVEVKDPSAFQPGTQATFYTEGWIFGSGVAVKELGHEFNPSGTAPAEGGPGGETALGQLQKQQQGIFFLRKDQISGDPTASLGSYQVDAYTCLKSGDWLPLSEEARVRSLVKK